MVYASTAVDENRRILCAPTCVRMSQRNWRGALFRTAIQASVQAPQGCLSSTLPKDCVVIPPHMNGEKTECIGLSHVKKELQYCVRFARSRLPYIVHAGKYCVLWVAWGAITTRGWHAGTAVAPCFDEDLDALRTKIEPAAGQKSKKSGRVCTCAEGRRVMSVCAGVCIRGIDG